MPTARSSSSASRKSVDHSAWSVVIVNFSPRNLKDAVPVVASSLRGSLIGVTAHAGVASIRAERDALGLADVRASTFGDQRQPHDMQHLLGTGHRLDAPLGVDGD